MTEEVIASTSEVNEIIFDNKHDRIVAATDGGVLVWRIGEKTGELWTAVDGLCGTSVSEVIALGDDLWFGTKSGGVCRREESGKWSSDVGGRFLVNSRYEEVTAIAGDQVDGTWVATSLGTVWHLPNDGGWELVVDGIEFGDVRVDDMLYYNGRIALAYRDGTVTSVSTDGANAITTLLDSSREVESRHHRLVADNRDRLWYSDGHRVVVFTSDGKSQSVALGFGGQGVMVARSGGGVISCGVTDDRLTCYEISESLVVKEVVSIAIVSGLAVSTVTIDLNNVMVVGFQGGGIRAIDLAKEPTWSDVYNIPPSRGPGNWIHAIGVSGDGSLAVSVIDSPSKQHLSLRTGEGVWRHVNIPEHLLLGDNETGVSEVLTPDEIAWDRDGVVWIARGQDILRYDGTEWTRVRGPNDEWLTGASAVALTSSGDAGFISQRGLFVIDHGQREGHFIHAAEECGDQLTGIDVVGGDRWLLSSACGPWISTIDLSELEQALPDTGACAEVAGQGLMDIAAQSDTTWWLTDGSGLPMLVDQRRKDCQYVQRVGIETIAGVNWLGRDEIGGMWAWLDVELDPDERFADTSYGRIAHWSSEMDAVAMNLEEGVGGTVVTGLAWDSSLASLWVTHSPGGLTRLRVNEIATTSISFLPAATNGK